MLYYDIFMQIIEAKINVRWKMDEKNTLIAEK